MTAEISTLSEGLLAEGTLEGSEAGVLAEMIAQVAALLEDASALGVLTLEIELYSLSFGVFHANRLMPLLGNSLESLMFISS